jgi:UDP-GlcNAc:undecaprenyl-phosphate/decaprenyl-phosphate GlcNAc-1-phosphate transferase
MEITFGLTGITAFLISYLLIPFIIRFSRKKNLFDVPEKRRIHKKMKPSLGGAAIFAGFVFGVILWIDASHGSFQYLILPILIIPFILGLVDDLTHLRPAAKIIGQAITASLLFFILDIRIESFYGLIPNGDLSIIPSYLLTTIIVIVITNSFNLIDGIDGLAAVTSLIAITVFGTWFYFIGDMLTALLCVAFSGAILAFLLHNWEPSKIFMGDTGSLVIGTMLAMLAIRFLNANHSLPLESQFKFESPIAAILCILVIPLVDMTRVVVIRVSKGISPFKADKRHLHHTLVRLGKSHRYAVLALCAAQILFVLIGLLLQKASSWIALTVVVLTATAMVLILDYIIYKAPLRSPIHKPESDK